jgi:hypothetical protein
MNTSTNPPAGGTKKEDKVYSIEEVLAEEVKVIHDKELATTPHRQPEEERRKRLNDDQRSKFSGESSPVGSRYKFYSELNSLNRAALCCSGGGIRSATFCLGVIQAFAAHDLSKTSTTADPSAPRTAPKESVLPKNSALGCFHYLSTVSGGGYIGSWLSTWRKRANFDDVIKGLTERPNGPDIEPAEISWLRAYSNYLTPRLGVTSADSWAAVAITLRNLILNWLVIIPVVCMVLLSLKLIAAVSVWISHDGDKFYPNDYLSTFVLLAGIVCLIGAQAFTTCFRPSRRGNLAGVTEAQFFMRDLVWAVVSAMAITICVSSHYFFSDILKTCAAPEARIDLRLWLPTGGALTGSVIYLFGWLARYCVSPPTALRAKQHHAASRPNLLQSAVVCLKAPVVCVKKAVVCLKNGWDVFAWMASGLVYGAVVGLGVYLYSLLEPYSNNCRPTLLVLHLLIPMIFGVPWVLMAQLFAEVVFVGFTSYETDSDADREWLGRAAGWLAVAAVVWALVAFLVFAGGYFVQDPDSRFRATRLAHKTIVALGGVTGIVSGIVTALLGSSSKTSAKPKNDDQSGVSATISNVVLSLAGPIFVAVLIIALSVGLDRILLDESLASKAKTDYSLIKILQNGAAIDLGAASIWLFVGLIVVAVLGWVASYFVNINRFSLHALYRNRLIRCYLGASNKDRKPDLFSGFDFNDNFCVNELWVDDWAKKQGRLYHVINIALNVVSTKRLAWQERKAEPFTVSPRHCGSSYLGFRSSNVYGGDKGLSLGTAMAISGAAASPNMGYNSSPSIALLLTLFNVRLGWWLGNPGAKGKDTYDKEGPEFAARSLLSEAFGQTSDTSPYVYLSDGGHFENLGLYEMVRRRCRFIVAIDAGCDPHFTFEDLGNAVRKIYIDLGVRIDFKKLDKLKTRPSAKSYSRAVRDAEALASLRGHDKDHKGSKPAEPGQVPYYAIGVIHYEDADISPPSNQGAKPEEAAAPKEAAKPEEAAAPQPAKSVKNGYVLYIKPAYHDDETSAGIRSYAMANPDFPHETTLDQWFTESQFESYRSLGLDIANNILNQRHEIVLKAGEKRKVGETEVQDPHFTLDCALNALKIRP